MKRDFISILDFTSKEILYLLDLTKKIKRKKALGSTLLKGKTLGLIFQKPSLRTRVSFEVGIRELGGGCIYLGPDEININVRETTEDVAKTLSRYLDGIVARTFGHNIVLDLAKYSSIPVINGLSDFSHPCQALTDIFSIQENFGKLKGLTMAYIGDGNNVCNSLLFAAAKVGLNVRVASPKGYEPDPSVLKMSQEIAKQTGSQLEVSNDPAAACHNADVIYSDVWVSMGQEEETKKRLSEFEGFQINKNLAKVAKKNFIFMHCLPAHRGQEVTADVIDGKHSIVFDQAENRLHTQKAIMMHLFKGRHANA